MSVPLFSAVSAAQALFTDGNRRWAIATTDYPYASWRIDGEADTGNRLAASGFGFSDSSAPYYPPTTWPEPSYDRSDLRFFYVSEDAAHEQGDVFLRVRTYRHPAHIPPSSAFMEPSYQIADKLVRIPVGASQDQAAYWNPQPELYVTGTGSYGEIIPDDRRVKPGDAIGMVASAMLLDLDFLKPGTDAEVEEGVENTPGYIIPTMVNAQQLPRIKIHAAGDSGFVKITADPASLITFAGDVTDLDASQEHIFHLLPFAGGVHIPVTIRLYYSSTGTPETYQLADEVRLLPVELYSDLNNDGQLTSADAGLVGKPYESGASDEEKAKGTEHMFVNDQISNGAHDREDTSSDDPSEDDDDAKGIHIKVGLNTGKVWLDHPAIDALTFYKHKSCYPDEKLKLKEADPFDLEGTEQLPDTIYARCDGDLNVPDDNPQSLGDLILKYLPKSGGQYIQLAKTKVVVVKELGSTEHHQTAMDYINENNTTGYTGKVTRKGTIFDRSTYYTVMFEGRTQMYGVNAGPKSLKGITAVKDSADWKLMTAIINATYNHDNTTPDNGFVHTHQGEQYIRSHTDPATSTHWDQTCSVKVEPRVYLAYGGAGVFATAMGHVPTSASDGAGALKTEADIAASPEGYTLVAFVKVGQEKLLFVASSEWSVMSGETAGKFHEKLKKGATSATIIHCDGGRNVALATANAAGTGMVTRIEGPAHQGYPLTLYPKTYLAFKAVPPRL